MKSITTVFLTPPQAAKRLGVRDVKVLRWIKTGQLRAHNMTCDPNGQPRFKIALADLLAFVQSRVYIPAGAPAPRPRQTEADIVQYI
jgi:excisionase family DNA binding protein